MLFKKSLLPFAVVLALGTSSFAATIAIGTLQADMLKDSAGVAAPATSLFFLVASTSNATFGTFAAGSSTAAGSLLFPGGDDYIIARGSISSVGELDVALNGLQFPGTIPNWDSGDPLALVWFPSLTSASTTLTLGSRYGLYSNPLAVDNSAAWLTPSSGSIKLLFYTKDGTDLSPGAGAANPAAAGLASFTVVPEPASLGLLGVGAIGLLARRRRSVK